MIDAAAGEQGARPGNRTHRDTSEKAKDAVNRFVAPSVPLSRRHMTVPTGNEVLP